MSNEGQTKLCKHCQVEIPKKAKVCPNCHKKQGGILKWIVIVVVVIIIFSALAGGDDDSDKGTDSNPKKTSEVQSTDGTEKNKEESTDNTFKVGDVVETSNLKISFLSTSEHKEEYLAPKDGYVYYRMEFEFENIGDSEETISSLMNWECYADSYAMEQAWVGDDTLDATIAPGKKAKGSVYYEVPKDAKEIILEYETNFFTEDKVVFVVK